MSGSLRGAQYLPIPSPIVLVVCLGIAYFTYRKGRKGTAIFWAIMGILIMLTN